MAMTQVHDLLQPYPGLYRPDEPENLFQLRAMQHAGQCNSNRHFQSFITNTGFFCNVINEVFVVITMLINGFHRCLIEIMASLAHDYPFFITMGKLIRA